MNLLESVSQFAALLKKGKIQFCVIGGVAVLLYGGRASTIDFDLYLLMSDIDRLVGLLEKKEIKFRKLGADQIKVFLPGLTVDILIADQWMGIPALKRAKKIKLGKISLQVASPEDLIVMKTLADRTIDRRDIEELREIFGSKLNEKYIAVQLKLIRKEIES